MKLPPAILLTGATGLLGRFILRRLLQDGNEVAVVVRPGIAGVEAGRGDLDVPAKNQQQSALSQLVRRRIEQVLQPFETQALLPRPRVIAWDFAESSQPGQMPNIDSDDLKWLQGRELCVVHCAASIRFQEDELTGEPFRTNVNGTRNLLQLCKALSVSAFHHVSTAYVGQHRSSELVMEVPATSQETAGNDYERSKIQAEQLVMQCPHVGSKTIHRPSIVIGDSQTGFTSTFHGFYAPLQIGWQYAKMFGFSEQAGQWFRQQLGLNPTDRKNLVSVDWVAEGIALAVQKRASQKHFESEKTTILHWTNPEPIACQVMQSAIVDAIERASKLANPTRNASLTTAVGKDVKLHGTPSPEQFREQMRVYESYFQTDPNFDQSQVGPFSEQLTCPKVGYELLTKLSDWAIQANFGWPKPSLPTLSSQGIVDAIRNFDWLDKGPWHRIVRAHILGPGAPESLSLSISAAGCFLVPGHLPIHETWRVSLSVLADCIFGKTDLSQSTQAGYWLIEGKTEGGGLDNAQVWINHIKKSLN